MTALKAQMLRRLNKLLLALAISAFAFVSVPARADEATTLMLLKQPGVHAIMRHALAPGFSDPAEFQLNACNTQRNLNESGRQQAKAVGGALKAAGITFDQVLTSQWCRCRETAALLDLGKPADFPGLNSFFEDRSTAEQQTDEVRGLLRGFPQGQKVMLVTHQVNITALTGRGVSSGEIFFIKLDAAGKVSVVGEFLLPPP